jgi:hypothetical protein
MKFIKFILILTLLQKSVLAQVPLLQWQKSLGGSDDDVAYAIKQTADGGYIIAGSSASQDGDVTGNHYNSQYPEDFWVVKTDACGTLQWEKSFGGTGRDIAYSVQQTTDKGYIVAGFTNSTDGDITFYHGGAADFWIIKLDTSGTVKWQETLGGAGEDGAQAIQQTTDGGYIAVGWSSSNGDTAGDHDFDYWVVKLDTGGAVKWQKLYGGLHDDTPFDIQQTADGGYIAAGYSQSNDGDVTGHHGTVNISDYWVIKIDTGGVLKWEKSYGGTQDDQANAIRQTSDGGYILAGYTSSANGDVTGNHGAYDYWLVKTDTVGTVQWKNCYGGTNNDQAFAITLLPSGNYAVAGTAYSNDGNVSNNHGGIGDYWVVNINSTGALQWQKTLGGSGGDAASAIAQTTDGGLVVAGASNSADGDITSPKGSYDYWIVKLDVVSGNTSICSGAATTLTASGAASYNWLPGSLVTASITVSPSSTTVYTLTAFTGTCTVNTNTISVSVNALPVITFSTLGFPDTLCSTYGGQSLTGGMPSGGIYNGTGVTANVFNPSSVGIGTYTLSYYYTDGNNCSNSATHEVTVELCTATDINSFINSGQTIIYPNPFVNNVQIVSGKYLKKVLIYDVIGNRISEFSAENNAKEVLLALDELVPGIYFAEIYFSDGTSVIRKINK